MLQGSRFQRKQDKKKYKESIKEISRARKAKNIESVSGKGYVAFENVEGIVKSKIKDRNIPFMITLQSSKGKFEFSKRFVCMRNFERWLAITLTSDKQLEYGQWILVENELTDLLSHCKVKVTPIVGGCNKLRGASCKTSTVKNFKIGRYDVECYNPISENNCCAFKCLEMLLNKPIFGNELVKMRKQYNMKSGDKVSIADMSKMYYENGGKTHLIIIDNTYNLDIFLDKYKYVLINKEHYYVVVNATSNEVKETCPTKRGELYWDIETRKTEEYCMVGNTKSYYLKDSITMAYYRNYKSETYNSVYFASNKDKSSVRQFLDWLIIQSHAGHQYNCVAHNGARFDHYFLTSAFSEYETLHCDIQLRGVSIIGLHFSNHMFKDSYCFMTFSLDKLCSDFKVGENSKKKDFLVNGKKLTNMELCFYRPELTFAEFMALEINEPEYWSIYKDYCLYDCISLSVIWSKFNCETNSVIKKMGSHLLRNCSVASCNTVGSLAKKLIDNINKKNPHFIEYKEFINDEPEKYEFVCKFKRGGISHVNQPGKHIHEVVSYDICSQYPTSLVEMKIPAGKSDWVTKYRPELVGYYHIKNLEWNVTKAFKPIAGGGTKEESVLNWTRLNKEMYVDSFMIQYLMKNYGLISFDVIKGLVSNRWIKGSLLFGNYVNTLFKEKALQDEYKTNDKTKYNAAYREVIKLFLNSLTGKLVEDPSKYFTMEYTLDKVNENNDKLNSLNGVNIKENVKDKLNVWVNAGVMVYSYSKRLLFEYVKCLPNNSDDIINVETDSMYFNKKHEAVFLENIADYCGEYPVAVGNLLGNVKQEYNTNQVSYFLGKKLYSIEGTIKIKGCPVKTIDENGSTVRCVDISLYERVFNGETVSVEFMTLKKELYGQTFISCHKMSRCVRPMMEYKLYT